MGWGWVEYAFSIVGGFFALICALISIIWGNLNERIKQINDGIIERVVDLDKNLGKHDSEINDNRLDITAIENILAERKEDNNRRFGEVTRSIDIIRTEMLAALVRIETKLDSFRERWD